MGTCRVAKDIMSPRVSVCAKDSGEEVVRKLMSPYPALPVVNSRGEVIGIVSEYDVLGAVSQGRTIHEFSAESIMNCGHPEHTGEACTTPVTVSPATPVDDVVELMLSDNFTVLPVVERKKLIGVISRKNVMNALAERGFWPGHEFRQRTPIRASR